MSEEPEFETREADTASQGVQGKLTHSLSSDPPPKGRTDGFFCALAYGVFLFVILFSIYLGHLARNTKGPVIVSYHFGGVVLALLSAFMGYRRTENPSGATLIILILCLMYLVLILPAWVSSILTSR